MNYFKYFYIMALSVIVIPGQKLSAQVIPAPQIDSLFSHSDSVFYNGSYQIPYAQGPVDIVAGAVVSFHSTTEITLLPGFTASVSGGCAEFTAGIKMCPEISANATVNHLTCYNSRDGSIYLNPSGGNSPYLFSWTPEISGSSFLRNLSKGFFSVNIVDQSNCSVSENVLLNSPDSIIISYSTTNSTCSDSTGTAIIHVTGSGKHYNYFWFPYGDNDSLANNLASGHYTINIVDSMGCSANTTLFIADNTGPIGQIAAQKNVSCYGFADGSASVSIISGSAPFQYDWIGKNINDSLATQLRSGEYIVKINDSNFCHSFVSVKITEPDPLNITIASTPSGCLQSIGSAEAFVSGGNGSYYFSWSSGDSTSQANGLIAGFYDLTVSDENGCMVKKEVLINNADGPIVVLSNVKNLSCFNSNDGAIQVVASNGMSPYNYVLLPNIETSNFIVNLQAGTHMLLVTDAMGCKSWKSFEIHDPPPIDVTLYYNNPSSDSTNDGEIFAMVKGGNPPYSYNWGNSDITGSFLKNIRAIDYNLIVSDKNNCSVESSIMVRGHPSKCERTNDCLPFYTAPCPLTTHCIKDIVIDFGADPTGLTNSQCAFEAASDFFNARGGNGTLNIPAGNYIVGAQFPKSVNPNMTFGISGNDVFCLRKCKNFIIQGKIVGGQASKIIFDNCLEYGAFDRVSGQRLIIGGPFSSVSIPYNNLSSPGNFFIAYECENITLKNLDIDGNSDNLSYGGHFNDGIQISASGIILNSSLNVVIDNVNVHHFGQDGLAVYDNMRDMRIPSNGNINPRPNINLTINNSKFNWNGRIGFYWGGGRGVNAFYSEFSNNAIARFGSKAEDGVDYEYFGGAPMENGFFRNCNFNHNVSSPFFQAS